ncbi:MAG: ribbon-helix-helix protein, CopG family [Tepidiformaceae bacterium]
MRTIIELPEQSLRALGAYCEREKMSRAEAIRRAVAALLHEDARKGKDRKAALAATFGMWKDRGVDTDAYLAELRAEWDR